MSDSSRRFIPSEFLNPTQEFTDAMHSMELHWWYWDNVNKRLYISERLKEILGYSAEEFDPSIPTLDKNIHPDDASENVDIFKSLLAGDIDVYEIEYRLKVNGHWAWYYNRGVVTARDERGKALFAGGITMDISRRFTWLMGRVEEGSKFEFIFRNTREPVAILELNEESEAGQILQVNRQLRTFSDILLKNSSAEVRMIMFLRN